jgi:hypothetical protein
MPSILPNWSYLYLCSRPLVVEERVSKKEGREEKRRERSGCSCGRGEGGEWERLEGPTNRERGTERD